MAKTTVLCPKCKERQMIAHARSCRVCWRKGDGADCGAPKGERFFTWYKRVITGMKPGEVKEIDGFVIRKKL